MRLAVRHVHPRRRLRRPAPVRLFPVEAPEPLAPVDRATLSPLGRLGPALVWLATAQGAWPPHVPRAVRRVVVDGSGSGSDEGAFEHGVAQADEIADAAVDLVVLGGEADPVAGIVAAAVLLGLEPVEAVGTSVDTAVDGRAWASLTVGVRDGLRTTRVHRRDPAELLQAIASPALSHATGLLVQAAVRRTAVILDGSPLVCGAALVAERLAPRARAWWLAGQAPPTPAARRALDDLGLAPLLRLEFAAAAGAELARSVLEQAVALVDSAGSSA